VWIRRVACDEFTFCVRSSELAGYGEASINALNSPEVTEPVRAGSSIVPRARTPFPTTIDSYIPNVAVALVGVDVLRMRAGHLPGTMWMLPGKQAA
jgi:hypothetical protein